MTNKTILIIQNTNYHFETTVSLYSSLLRLNPAKLSIVKIPNIDISQKEFTDKYRINTISHVDSSVYNYDVAFIVSAYPNPHVTIQNSIPLINHRICQYYKKSCIFLCHRFNRASDFRNHTLINLQNSLSLSRLSTKIGLDYWYPTEYPVTPFYQTKNNYCIQGHFELNNRVILPEIMNYNDKFQLSMIGANADDVIQQSHTKCLSNLSEIDFYNAINNQKFILAMIDDKIKNGTYIKQRFSTNFLHACALEKPIFCHQIFKEIYEIPGVYYDDINIYEKFQELINLSEDKYYQLVNQFVSLKTRYNFHNDNILRQKINTIK